MAITQIVSHPPVPLSEPMGVHGPAAGVDVADWVRRICMGRLCSSDDPRYLVMSGSLAIASCLVFRSIWV